MKTKFYAPNGCPIVFAIVRGNHGYVALNMLVDTGASYTSLNSEVLKEISVTPTTENAIIVSATSVAELFTASVPCLESLGIKMNNMKIVVLNFPEGGVKIDGVLGVDFFANKKLTIDFSKNTIAVK